MIHLMVLLMRLSYQQLWPTMLLQQEQNIKILLKLWELIQVSSIINLYEAPVAWVQEQFGAKRGVSVAIIGLFGMAVSLMIQPWTSQWMDIISIYICPIGAFLAAVMFFWVLKKDTALEAVAEGRAKPIGMVFFFLI